MVVVWLSAAERMREGGHFCSGIEMCMRAKSPTREKAGPSGRLHKASSPCASLLAQDLDPVRGNRQGNDIVTITLWLRSGCVCMRCCARFCWGILQ